MTAPDPQYSFARQSATAHYSATDIHGRVHVGRVVYVQPYELEDWKSRRRSYPYGWTSIELWDDAPLTAAEAAADVLEHVEEALNGGAA